MTLLSEAGFRPSPASESGGRPCRCGKHTVDPDCELHTLPRVQSALRDSQRNLETAEYLLRRALHHVSPDLPVLVRDIRDFLQGVPLDAAPGGTPHVLGRGVDGGSPSSAGAASSGRPLDDDAVLPGAASHLLRIADSLDRVVAALEHPRADVYLVGSTRGAA